MAELRHSSVPMPAEQHTAEKKPEPTAEQCRTAEKRLNYFVGAVALMERIGNCLGTLAFTWATVVVLGGFSTNLGLDFWYATAIVFLEAFRVFSRESRSDDELLFKTTGSIRLKRMKLSRSIPYYLTVSIVIVCMYGTLEFSLRHYGYTPPQHLRLQYHILLLAILLALASLAQAPTAAEYLKEHPWLQFLSALIAVLALGAAMFWSHTPKHEVLLIIPPLFIGSLQSVFKELGTCLRSSRCNLDLPKFQDWFGTLVSLILPSWIVISVLLEFTTMGVLILLGTVLLSNIQIPVAVARVVLSSVRLSSKDNSHGEGTEHLMPALTIFYSMVLAQGVLYLAACILESLLSSRFRRSLARSCNLLNKKGYDSINLYYEHAYNKRMQEGVLAQEDMGLVSFALHYLDSNSNDKKLAAVIILDSLLHLPGTSNTKLVSEITTSTKVVASLINMLGWTASDDEQDCISIRYFAAKVIASLAGDLRIVAIPGTIQMISSLLYIDAKSKKTKQDIVSNQISDKNELNTNEKQQRSNASSILVNIQGGRGDHARKDGQELLKQVEGGNKTQSSNAKSRFFKCINNMVHDIEEGNEPSKDMNWFPRQGMLILERLAHDLGNCKEIDKAIGLIPKIIGFIINSTDTTNDIMTSSLKLIAQLVTTEGELGKTIRKKIFHQPFFFSNLVEILVDSNRYTEQWNSMMVIIAKIILEDTSNLSSKKENTSNPSSKNEDTSNPISKKEYTSNPSSKKEDTSNDIEKFRVIIPKLVHAFLGPVESSKMKIDRRLQTLAGEALSKLVERNTSFCMTILKDHCLIGDLKKMLEQDEYTYMVANLLIKLCESQEELDHRRPVKQLSSILGLVLKKILDAEGKQLEALIISASQLHSLILDQFARELESHTNKENFVQKLVDALNSNKKICDEFPRMRRAIVKITISIVESCPHYSPIFKSKGMIEALYKVERILAKVEKYKAFLGDAKNDFDSALPSSDLVIRAKKLVGSETPSQESIVHDSSPLDIVHEN